MGTSAPVRREFDVPIVEPYKPKAEPKALPGIDPERVITAEPLVTPERVPVHQPMEQPLEVGI